MNASPFWVLASNNPADLAHFYAALANENAIKKGAIWLVAFAGAGELLFYCPSRQRSQPAQVGRLALCLPVTKLEQAIALALTLGGQLLEPSRQESFGREAWLADPEGNKLLLLEPAEVSQNQP